MTRKSTRGFTLIELLVVIAIIALLVGILLPSLASARRSAQMTISALNMKSLATTHVAYSGDYKDSWMNPFDPIIKKWFPNTTLNWADILQPQWLQQNAPVAWRFGDGSRSAELFGAHWASLMTFYIEQGGLQNNVQFSPLDRQVIQRYKAQLANTDDREDFLYDTTYFYSPTFLFTYKRYWTSQGLPVGIADENLWRRNRLEDVTHPQAKVLLFERFDFAQDWRFQQGGRVKQSPNWNNPGATGRFALADGSISTIKMKDLNALANSSVTDLQNTFTPSGVWNPSQAQFQLYGMESDGLENGSNGSSVHPSHFWATRNGLRGRDINR